MTVLAKLQVLEEHGIRRFLYPLAILLKLKTADADKLAVQDSAGGLLPCEFQTVGSRTLLTFAVSLAPYERKRLTVIRSDVQASVPDPICCTYLSEGLIVNRQERVSTTLTSALDLTSVVYDGVEHLAGPVAFQLNGESPNEKQFRTKSRDGQLGFVARSRRSYDSGSSARTEVTLTACKSWITVTHEISRPPAGSLIAMTIPLTPDDSHENPVCDFGVGNGVYSKIDGDAVEFDATFFGKSAACFWQISRQSEGIERIDYQGQYSRPTEFSDNLWFHWTLANRALAVAITEWPKGSVQLNISLGRTGKIEIIAVLGDNPPKQAKLGACLHFLNAIPPIAAATNPASILCPPRVVIKG